MFCLNQEKPKKKISRMEKKREKTMDRKQIDF